MNDEIKLNNLEKNYESLKEKISEFNRILDKKVGKNDTDYEKMKENLGELSNLVYRHKEILGTLKEKLNIVDLKLDKFTENLNGNNVELGKHTEVLNRINDNLASLNEAMDKVKEETVKNTGTSFYVKQLIGAVLLIVLTSALTALGAR